MAELRLTAALERKTWQAYISALQWVEVTMAITQALAQRLQSMKGGDTFTVQEMPLLSAEYHCVLSRLQRWPAMLQVCMECDGGEALDIAGLDAAMSGLGQGFADDMLVEGMAMCD